MTRPRPAPIPRDQFVSTGPGSGWMFAGVLLWVVGWVLLGCTIHGAALDAATRLALANALFPPDLAVISGVLTHSDVVALLPLCVGVAAAGLVSMIVLRQLRARARTGVGRDPAEEARYARMHERLAEHRSRVEQAREDAASLEPLQRAAQSRIAWAESQGLRGLDSDRDLVRASPRAPAPPGQAVGCLVVVGVLVGAVALVVVLLVLSRFVIPEVAAGWCDPTIRYAVVTVTSVILVGGGMLACVRPLQKYGPGARSAARSLLVVVALGLVPVVVWLNLTAGATETVC